MPTNVMSGQIATKPFRELPKPTPGMAESRVGEWEFEKIKEETNLTHSEKVLRT